MIPTTNSAKNSTRGQRTVWFSASATVTYVENSRDWESSEIDSYWYHPLKFELTRELRRSVAENHPADDPIFDRFGLESAQRLDTRQKRAHAGQDLVLDLQIQQWQERINEEDEIAELYGSFSRKCSQSARLRALKCSREVAFSHGGEEGSATKPLQRAKNISSRCKRATAIATTGSIARSPHGAATFGSSRAADLMAPKRTVPFRQ